LVLLSVYALVLRRGRSGRLGHGGQDALGYRTGSPEGIEDDFEDADAGEDGIRPAAVDCPVRAGPKSLTLTL
jgi:hypothetical protein